MTLAITIACLSLAGDTFNRNELREVSPNDPASVLGPYHSMICDAVTGKVYMVTETKPVRQNSDEPRASEAPRLEPSKFVYFEYLGRTASYPHVVCQMKDHGLSEQERQRVSEAYRALQGMEDREPAGQAVPLLCRTGRSGRRDGLVLVEDKRVMVGSTALPMREAEQASAK